MSDVDYSVHQDTEFSVVVTEASTYELAIALSDTSERLAETQKQLLRVSVLLARAERDRDSLASALKASTNGLRHVTRWNISEQTEMAIRTQIFANENVLELAGGK